MRMHKIGIVAVLLIFFSVIYGINQQNIVPNKLKILYPFSINLKFEKVYNYIKAELPEDKEISVYDDKDWKGTSTDNIELSLIANSFGKIDVPMIPVIVYDDLGADTLYTKPFSIEVEALTDSTSTINDLKPINGVKEPILMKSNWSWVQNLFKLLIIFLLVGLSIWLIFKYWYKIKQLFVKDKYSEEDILVTAWDFAHKELKLIKKRMLLSPGNEYLFSIEFSLLIRRFLERYYNFPAAERTTLELKKEFIEYNVLQAKELIDVLMKTDEVKYTKGKIINNFDSEDMYNDFISYVKMIEEIEKRKNKEEVTDEVQ